MDSEDTLHGDHTPSIRNIIPNFHFLANEAISFVVNAL